MGKCDQIQDLILTDMVDRQASAAVQQQVEAHMVSCVSCRVFYRQVIDQTIKPLTQMPVQQVPEHIWEGIKACIEQQPVKQTIVSVLFNKISELWQWPGVVPVAAMCCMMVIVAGTITYKHYAQLVQKDQEGAYLVSLLDNSNDDNSKSSIEQYFL